MCGIFFWSGPRLLGLIDVELREFTISFSLPGSFPPVFTRSSPRMVPFVCDGLLVFDVYFSGIENLLAAYS
jgi:hypothetical protein